MSAIAARKFAAIVQNLAQVLAIEMIAAFQAMEFLRPLKSSKTIEEVRRSFRRVVQPWTRDRVLAPDLAAARAFLDSETMRQAVEKLQ